MNQDRKTAFRSVLPAAATLAAALLVAVAAHPPSGDAATLRSPEPCKKADAPASETSSQKLRKSVRCLINEERAVHGFGKLTHRQALQVASQRHTKVMVKTDCLAHRCPGELDLEARLRHAGYFEGAEMWHFAENTGCAASAASMVAGWMDVRFHRVNILNADFDDLGVGIVHKRVDERCDKGFATFAVVFGNRGP
jgi:uncharacterized protein YkwD